MDNITFKIKKVTKIFIIFATISIISLKINAQTEEFGKASYYANKFEGRPTASGETYYHNKLTAAHRTLPFGTSVKVINLENNKEVTVRINDRGPFVEDRIIDVSKSAAEILGFVEQGLVDVKILILSEKDVKKEVTVEPKIDTERELEESNDETDSDNIKETESEFVMTIVPENQPSKTSQTDVVNFSVKCEKTDFRGFGIQIASYKELSNILEQCAIIEKELKQQVILQVVNDSGTKTYRLIVGLFDTRSKAEYFKDTIKGKYPGIFVVTF